LLAPSIAKQIAVMHGAMLPVPTLSPLAEEKAAQLRLQLRPRAPERRVLTNPVPRVFAAYYGDFSVIAKDLLPAHTWGALPKTGHG
jgi:hypothetical protein